MDYTLVCKKDGHLHLNGEPTHCYIQYRLCSEGKRWRVVWLGQPVSRHLFTAHKRKKDVIAACRVFIDGMTVKAGETFRNAAIRAIDLCGETGGTFKMANAPYAPWSYLGE